jgi:acylphosphatase
MPALGIAAQSSARRLIEALRLAEILRPESGAMLSNRLISEGEGARLANGRRATTMSEKKEAISGTVTGNDQRVGFRAMIMKQAIEYNLAGFTKNLPNDVVNFTLQGDGKRLANAVSAIREGTKKSSDIKVSTTQGTVDPALNAFTIYAWTSTTRNITNPYDLVFHLRSDDGKLAPANVKTVWHGILQSTLKGDDLKKLGPDD